ncbi:MAG TPA: adenylate/guanylate cyclase domain-containing protein [Chthoniobacteraceae bacterium]|nr:adenylate/guanylate cyclase domain-containing protein [Chthoniobacteraceae bacterium]
MDAPLTPTRPLLATALAPVLPQLFGSAFNIWYNFSVVIPLLATDALRQRFFTACIAYNAIAYPLTILAWLLAVGALRPVLRRLLAGEKVAASALLAARRRAINLPWWGALLAGSGWLVCIPVFLVALAAVPGPLPPMLLWHLPISFLVSGFIAITHTFFVTELTTHRVLFPILFARERADQTPGALSLSLRGRGLLWAVSAGICPIGSLLLLSFAPPAPGTNPEWFAIFVGTVGIAFGLCTALMIARLVAEPIDHLRAAAQAVAQGRLDVEVPMHRADEFGLLAAEFNHMIGELRGKEQLRQTFGLHVGRRASEQILARDPGLSGVEQIITVMFVDIRSFTRRSEVCPPAEMVRLLNEFLKVMVEIVETQHGGMINKFLGDGFIALFGIGPDSDRHATDALRAGAEMLRGLAGLNERLAGTCGEPLAIGIGIHTGPAIVGSIGSPDRLEFTAIGSTVNLASRIEGLTKTVGTPLLLTAATKRAVREEIALREYPPQTVRGVDEPVAVYGLG